MPVQQFPLMKGLGKSERDADYNDLLPTNLLAVPKEVISASGYMRSFPGIEKLNTVAGTSRGVQYNTSQNAVYRVCGGKLYRGDAAVGDVSGSGRVPMAHSRTSQAVIDAGKVVLHRYDGTNKAIENWPVKEVTQEAEDRQIRKWTSTDPATGNTFTMPVDAAKGAVSITVTPGTTTGAKGDVMTIASTQWGLAQSQAVSTTKPYITDLLVTGKKTAGEVVTITYKLNIPTAVTGTNSTEFEARFLIPEIANEFTQYELGSAGDVVRVRGRYVWSKAGTDSFIISDIEDEAKPDRYSAMYRAESQPDGIIGLGVWNDYVVAFGTTTIEYFTLTGNSTAGAALYAANAAYMVPKGIAGINCKVKYMDAYAIISHPATGAPSVYIVDSGRAQPIATSRIERYLREYTAEELATSVMETVRFDSHELLIVHLPRHTLVYDATASQNGPQWSLLKTGLFDDAYRAIDFMYEGNEITCGDKLEAVTGTLRTNISSQYDKQQEHLLYTPIIKADNALLFDLELEASTGITQIADRMFISAATDGMNFGREQMIPWNAPFRYDSRAIWRRVGRVRKNISFKFRIITKAPVTLSGLSVRIE